MTVDLEKPSKSIFGKLATFVVSASSVGAALLGGYVWMVTSIVAHSNAVPNHKWLLLQNTPGPRLIVEAGSNAYQSVNTQMLSAAFDVNAINIADNAGYALADKIARLERYAEPEDVVILPLEWVYFTRSGLSDDYVNTILGSGSTYFSTLSNVDQVKRALSIPMKSVWQAYHADPATRASARDQIVAAHRGYLTAPLGHVSFAQRRGDNAIAAGMSCDAYLFDGLDITQPLPIASRFHADLKRLTTLQATGVQVFFAWPALAGDDCMTSHPNLQKFQEDVRSTVEDAGITFLGTPQDAMFKDADRDDTFYHLLSPAAQTRTARLIENLQEQGVTFGPRNDQMPNIPELLYGLERELEAPATIAALPVDQGVDVKENIAKDRLAFSAGWWPLEGDIMLARGADATLDLRLPTELPFNSVLELSGRTLTPEKGMINLRLNGQEVAAQRLSDDEPLRIDLPPELAGEQIELSMQLQGAPAPNLTGNMDGTPLERPLYWGLTSAKVTARPVVPGLPPIVEELPVQTVDCRAPNIMPSSRVLNRLLPTGTVLNVGDDSLSEVVNFDSGWWDSEPNGRWIGKSIAHMSFILPATDDGLKLNLTFDVFSPASRVVQIRYDGMVLFDDAISDSGVLELDVSALPRKREVILRFIFATPDLDCPAGQLGNTDSRQLAAMLLNLTLVEANQVATNNLRLPGEDEASFLIAKAGGLFEGRAGTNSLDALDANRDAYDFFEMDLTFTFDGQLICLADWELAFQDRFGFVAEEPLDHTTFTDLLTKTDIQGATNCTLDTLASWMYKNNAKRVITRFNRNELQALNELADAMPSLKERFIVQVSDPALIVQARELGFKDVIWSMDRFAGQSDTAIAAAQDPALFGMSMTQEQARAGLLQTMSQTTGKPVTVTGVNSAEAVSCMRSLGAASVVTDQLKRTDLSGDPNAVGVCQTS